MGLQLKRLATLCLASVAFCGIVLTGLSRLHQESDPDQALWLNPFNAEASIARMEQGLTAHDSLAQLPSLGETGRKALRFSPIDAPVHGLLGEVYFRMGDEQTAEALFDTALSLSKTEATSLLRTLVTATENGDIVTAMSRLDILFRRWPNLLAFFAPAIADLMNSPEGYRAILETLRTKPPWRKQFLGFLNKGLDNVGLAYRLQLDLGGGVETARHREIAGTLRALLRGKHHGLAYRLFLSTLSDADRAHSGYVFNGQFALEPSGRPFDWKLRSNSGVSISLMADAQSGTALAMRFLGKPVKNIPVRQLLYLPAGRYRLTVNLDAANLTAPKGLFLRIFCDDPRKRVIRLDIPAGSYRGKNLSGDFELPDNWCGFFQLGFSTDLIAESFRYAYSGTLHIRSLAISKIAQ